MNLNRWIKNSVAWELKPANGIETNRWTADQLVNSECNQGRVKPAMWIKIRASGFGISCWIQGWEVGFKSCGIELKSSERL
jgi:hypothetical protein